MTSQKRICTRHHISMFLRRSQVLKIHPDSGQTPGTTTKGKGGDMANYEEGPF